MTSDELEALFEKHDGEYLEFGRIPEEQRLSQRPDLHAFLLLDRLVPSERHRFGHGHDMVSAAEHDEIWLAVEPEALCAVVTEERIVELIRCGVRLDSETDSLALFV